VSRGNLAASECTAGISIEKTGEATVTAFTARGIDLAIGGPFGANSPSPKIVVSGANITAPGDLPACNSAVLELGGSAFTLRDSIVDGGFFGVNSYDYAVATIERSTLRNQALGFLGDGSFTITDTTITGMSTAISPGGGRWTLDRVTLTGNGAGIELQTSRVPAPTLKMRGSTVSRSARDGITLSGSVNADLGTAADPGNNIIAGNTGIGLMLVTSAGQPRITAVGNTWNAGRQDADGDGRYIIVATLTGPITATPGNNFALGTGTTLDR